MFLRTDQEGYASTIRPGHPHYLPMAPQVHASLHCRERTTVGYGCTREPNHTGDHAAHGPDGEQYMRWGNDLMPGEEPHDADPGDCNDALGG